ncbi:hypothetical protein MBT84_38245 [Streptomyces sp. MBT84]|nr:hypothetical protein [Streptomyces sp. MBT84]MBW8705461.1 hypothetical protein [Streptomyces sp. MBT84]
MYAIGWGRNCRARQAQAQAQAQAQRQPAERSVRPFKRLLPT